MARLHSIQDFSHSTRKQMCTCGCFRGARVKCGHSRCRLQLQAVWERFARPVGAEPVGFWEKSSVKEKYRQ